MTSTTEHPDAQRLREIAENPKQPRQGIPMEEALVGYVDVDAMKTLTASYMWVLQKYAEVHLPALFDVLTAPDPAVAGAVATTYMDGFMTGVEFQIAGGHREVDA